MTAKGLASSGRCSSVAASYWQYLALQSSAQPKNWIKRRVQRTTGNREAH